jgi:predicted 2-oxoglutarate/Fe(II)-dependent dioxygenase YbiX
MRDVNGKTVEVQDRRHKSRSDYVITDMGLQQQIQIVFLRRVVPEIRKAYQFAATRMERYLVGCYDAENGGHFGAHRDNTTKGTAHRRFAVSVNLNDDFDGGEVSFPEYGRGGFKAPAGGAVVFSCSLLHAVSPIRRGKRYAFLPFLHDEAAARVRQANLQFIGGAAEIRAAG